MRFILVVVFFLMFVVVENKSITNDSHSNNNSITTKNNSSDIDKAVQEIMQVIQETTMPNHTTLNGKTVRQDMAMILQKILDSKESVKMYKNISEEIKWILEEGRNTIEKPRIVQLLKQDIRGIAENCVEMKNRHIESGVYTVYPDKIHSVDVYCDMKTDGGGWTVFQSRFNGKTDFQRNWESYKYGFGDFQEEFWLGNEKLSQLTKHGQYELRIDMESFGNTKVFAKYSKFSVGDESTKYRLTVGGYSSSAGDSLTYHNNMKFTTKDQDNDNWSLNCANALRNGGWWYDSCAHSALNGLYGQKSHNAIYWSTWTSYAYNIKTTIMMFRKVN